MPITDYASLIAEVQDYLVNDDATDTRVKNFISLAESRFNRELHLRRMIKSPIPGGIPSTGTVTLPTDYLDMAEISLADVSGDNPTPLEYVPTHVYRHLNASRAQGKPQFYTVIGDYINVQPAPDGSYTLAYSYYALITPLSDAAPTNWLLTLAPDLYLYASLLASAPFFEDDARLQVWTGFYQAAKKSLQVTDRRSKHMPFSTTRPFATSAYEGRRTYPGGR